MIRLEHISRTFTVGDELVHGLDDVNLQLEDGDYVSIMGPSGSGKSTLLNVLGLLRTRRKPGQVSSQIELRQGGPGKSSGRKPGAHRIHMVAPARLIQRLPHNNVAKARFHLQAHRRVASLGRNLAAHLPWVAQDAVLHPPVTGLCNFRPSRALKIQFTAG